MKKTTNYFCAILTVAAFAVNAQNQMLNEAEKAPGIVQTQMQSASGVAALWDIQKNINVTASSGGDVGMAGVAFINNEFWVSRWATDTLLRFTASGAFIDKFVISGLSGVRSFSTDGTTLFAGNNSNVIYRIDPTTKQLESPATISLSSSVLARFCAYDPNLDGGNGGFWIGTFGTDIQSVNMNGAVISTIYGSTFNLSGIYGAAVDYHTAGGSYLWVFNQGGVNSTDLVRLKLPTGSTTGATRDVYPDISATHSLTSALAGGVFVTDEVVSGKASLVALVQGTPDNVIVSYELGASTVGLEENLSTAVKVYPNPVKDFVTVSLDASIKTGSYNLIDITGKQVMTGSLHGEENRIDLKALPVGTYILQVITDGKKISEQKISKTE